MEAVRLHRTIGVRVGHRVNPPKMLTYGGQPAILQQERIRETTMGVSEKTEMYRTDWELTYLIPSAPTSIPLPANPALGTDGGI